MTKFIFLLTIFLLEMTLVTKSRAKEKTSLSDLKSMVKSYKALIPFASASSQRYVNILEQITVESLTDLPGNTEWMSSFKFKFYFDDGFQDFTQENLPSILNHPKFSSSKPTVLYLYGLTQNPEEIAVFMMKNAYVNAGYNFILFDVDTMEYFYHNIEGISDKIADSLIATINAGLNLETFDVVGFSLGAQYSGYVGRKVQEKSSGKIILNRIIALEPGILSPIDINENDAKFVMTMFTGDFVSEATVVSHVAFYINGGINQPMCQTRVLFVTYYDIECNHRKAQDYWTEAVNSKSDKVFPARKCKSAEEFAKKSCDKNAPIAYMNPKMSSDLRGNYYLSTNVNSPFSKASADP